ncbi:MAG TPA: hypothetical protein VEX15_16685 [Nocardioidaceae bacterium]|nr:hypothetical protein [Nocardioidaceae bacterium]
MGRNPRVLLASLVVGGCLVGTGCEEDGSAEELVSIESHLYGPGARLGRGVTVPDGAARVGPTITITQDPTDIRQISLLQIDGDPDQVLRDLLTELDRLLPDVDVDVSQARRRCWLDDTDAWIRQCRLLVTGHTADGRPLQVDITATPTADVDGEPLPGASGLPSARILVRTGPIREVGTNLDRPSGYPYSARDQDAAQWPISPDAHTSVPTNVDELPGTEDWPVQPGGSPIGVVYSNPRYIVVAVDEGDSIDEVATSYATSVPNRGLSTQVVATVGDRTTTSYQIDAIDGGPGAHLWAVERPGADYLFLRYWPLLA